MGSSRVLDPLTPADSSGRKRKPITAQFRIWEVTLNLEKFRDWLISRKDQKGLMKGEDLTVLEQTTQLTYKHSY